jgi:hypothetical protein
MWPKLHEIADAAVASEAVALLGAAMLHDDRDARKHLTRFYTDIFPAILRHHIRPLFTTDAAATTFADGHCRAAIRFVANIGVTVLQIGEYWRDAGPKVLANNLNDAIEEERKWNERQPTPPALTTCSGSQSQLLN